MEALHIQNTLSGKKEKFEPINPPKVGLYVCGPTVYATQHLGNARTFISFDVIRRYLKHIGYQVTYARNITDVGHITNSAGVMADSIGEKAKAEAVEPMQIVQKYTTEFHNLMHIFNIQPPDIEPTATGHIIEQIEMVEAIIKNGFAYKKNGSVYFDVPKFAKQYNYGKLSGRNIDEQQDGYRELEAQDEKNDPRDFAIWKHCDETYPQRYTSPWGKGVPGWHLECSVMSTKYLGKQFDIHGGGMDLKFPHHDCEIAQNIGAGEGEPVKYWMHTNMLTMNGKKMSKSLGNSIYPDELISGDNDIMEQGFSPMVIRFFMLQSHYSSELDLSNDALMAAEKGYKRLMNAQKTLNSLAHKTNTENATENESILSLCKSCSHKMNDDFNAPQTLAVLFELSNKINAYANKQSDVSQLNTQTFNTLKTTFNTFVTNILGLLPEDEGNQKVVNGLMQLVIDIRAEARTKKDWGTSDKIRNDLNQLKILIKDGAETTWTYE